MRYILIYCLQFLSLAALCQAVATSPAISPGNSKTGKFYSMRGFRMYTETYGTGQPLLIIHGNGGSMKDFQNQVPYFMKKYRVILADSRAHGRSVDTGDSLSYEQMADDFAVLLDSMHIDSAHVLGWSDGGINGLLLAMRHPEKVKKLAVTGANLWPDSTAVYPDIIRIIEPMNDSLNKKGELSKQDKHLKKLFHLLLDEPHIALTDLVKVKCPTLVIGGDHDVIREEHTMAIYQHIPKAYLWILPNSGHSTPVRYKEVFNTTVDDFFKKNYESYTPQKRFY
ncbi:alpha/beta fold hydrolase [Flavihumibacter solisilvae]|uniref:alpha/beta fold hydrolase n=1 Tax=Flavihumibacter solisilvae TaxID=1349421 RepID=UPI000691B57C|nr:alpha/beta hydrolase [Flavihumibacter solisilvae]